MIDPISSFASKLSSGAVGGPARPAAGNFGASGVDFGTALQQVAADAAQSLKTAEAVSVAGMEGRASAQRVVEAVMTAEQNLQAAIAIRDKVVNAYLELTRMAI
ncbi:flagellar hook-basal body complex protein FliE [Aestuariivirga sp. YIM B02566]|uniref:Flagellar hook-basal body complex protein FliE n=1 Tax=Taklimakanibacter albus TaxID=2800327 RepID=A0ACC5RAI4_9HYPH|nr:flagellar hook-basal body complex protein FliE [Aestuariivirga sp. YIM B02566]MBK1869647.1 flagellar hook-basal body complex protein FliE [Aestuariivirga sp. YIM B02566]